MRVHATALPDVYRLEPQVFRDDRGYFFEPWNAARMKGLGLDVTWVQDNHSRSAQHTIRGLHLQRAGGGCPGQAKLVRCARGAIVDVVVDVRPWSPTFKQHIAVRLDDENNAMLYIPVGFAHGFCVVSDVADVCYKVSSVYDAAREVGFRFDDTDVGVAWPVAADVAIVSARDRQAPTLAELMRTPLF